MTFYLITWIALSCPGGPLSGFIRNKLPILCEARQEELLVPSLNGALRKIQELGPGARPRVIFYRGLRRSERRISWQAKIEE